MCQDKIGRPAKATTKELASRYKAVKKSLRLLHGYATDRNGKSPIGLFTWYLEHTHAGAKTSLLI